MNITKSNIEAFHQLLQEEFDVKIVYKKHSWFMRFLAFFMTLLNKINKNIVAGDDFMETHATTIGNTVYLPYDPWNMEEFNGVGDIILLVHEITHSLQFRRDGFLVTSFNYLFFQRDRTFLELEAALCELCFYFKYYLEGSLLERYQKIMLIRENRFYISTTTYGISEYFVRMHNEAIDDAILELFQEKDCLCDEYILKINEILKKVGIK